MQLCNGRGTIKNVCIVFVNRTILFFFYVPIKTNMSTIIVGAKWCGYSQTQFNKLGCSDDGSCTIQEKKNANDDTAGTNPIQFIWCETDTPGEKVENPHPACDSNNLSGEMTGFPTWIHQEGEGENATLEVMQSGMVDPCSDQVKKYFANCDKLQTE